MRNKLLCVIVFFYISCKNTTSPQDHLHLRPAIQGIVETNKSYDETKEGIIRMKDSLKNVFPKLTLPEKSKLFTDAVVKKIIPCWYGTSWDYNGTTRIPKQGTIACGYFVTTVLEDAGLKIQRTKLAQAASEQMIRTLVEKKYIHRYSNIEPAEFISMIQQQGEGIYLVGLDNHTGFLYNEGNEIYFIDASCVGCKCVVKQKAIESGPLYYSKYRVTGKISGDEKILNRWILDR